jgi:hypothetical protein
MKLPHGTEERRAIPRELVVVIATIIVASVVILTIMALAYSIGRSLWG